jgi:hypothetical protein
MKINIENQEFEIIKGENGEFYIKKYENLNAGRDYVIVRTLSAGVFSGYLKSRCDKEVVLTNARRLWSWKGAASLSELAVKGVFYPNECKFPCEVSEVTLIEAIEILATTEDARICIQNVPVWSAHE